MQKFKKEILFLFLFFAVLSKSSIWAQKDLALKKKADLEFENKDYKSALIDYRQLIALDQKNTELNFKYATCIYFTDDIKKATRYYDLIINQPDVANEVFFYRAKIYQHQYDFQNAIKLFEKYKATAGKKTSIPNVDNEIRYCKNALANLKVPGSIKTIKRYDANSSDFYNTYSFTNIGYSFYQAKEVFTKFNEKNNFIPVNALVRGMKYRFFSSFSSDVTSRKDIFIQKKNEINRAMLELSEDQYRQLITSVSRKALAAITNLNQLDTDYYRTEEGLNKFLTSSNTEASKILMKDSSLVILLNESSDFLRNLKQKK